jgi:hypothetical protein
MGQIIRMPTREELPPGSVRDFTIMMFFLYKMAHRPTLREISKAIEDNDKLAGTASPETVRRMLRGKAVPQRWETVDAVMQTLCDMGERGPFAGLTFGGKNDTTWNHVDRLWHRALDEPHGPSVLYRPQPNVDDPWNPDPDYEYSEDAPFYAEAAPF